MIFKNALACIAEHNLGFHFDLDKLNLLTVVFKLSDRFISEFSFLHQRGNYFKSLVIESVLHHLTTNHHCGSKTPNFTISVLFTQWTVFEGEFLLEEPFDLDTSKGYLFLTDLPHASPLKRLVLSKVAAPEHKKFEESD